jgi:hypothetical protein
VTKKAIEPVGTRFFMFGASAISGMGDSPTLDYRTGIPSAQGGGVVTKTPPVQIDWIGGVRMN